MKSKKKRNISDTNLLLTITIVVFFCHVYRRNDISGRWIFKDTDIL